MQSFSRYAAITVLIVSLLVPQLYLAEFMLERGCHREEMREKLQQSKLDTIRMESSALRWMEAGKELLVNKKYFDVHDIRFENGWAIVTGVFDEKETEMHQAFASSEAQEQAEGGASSLIAQWLQQQWHQPTCGLHFLGQDVFETQLIAAYLKRPLYRTIAAPERPPQIIA